MKVDKVRLITLMAELDFSVGELAHRTGITKGTISSIRSGKSCSGRTAKALADALKIPLESLLREEAGL